MTLIHKNEDRAAEIIAAINANDGYCCCAIEHTPDTKCMCKEFRERIERGEVGDCHCGLYRIEVK